MSFLEKIPYQVFCCLGALILAYFLALLMVFPGWVKRRSDKPEKGRSFWLDLFLFLTTPIRLPSLLILGNSLKVIYFIVIVLLFPLTFIYLALRKLGGLFGRLLRGLRDYLRRMQEQLIWMEENMRGWLKSKSDESVKWGESIAGAILMRIPVIDLLTANSSIQMTQVLGLTSLFSPILLAVALEPKRSLETRKKAITGLAKLGRGNDLLHVLQPAALPELCLVTLQVMQDAGLRRIVVIGWSLLARHTNLDIRLKAAENLDALNKESEAQSAYQALMNDEKTPMAIRIQAAGRLARLGRVPETLVLLCDQMESNPATREKLAAAEALCAAAEKIEGAERWLDPILLRRTRLASQVILDYIFNTDVDGDTRAEAVRILGRLTFRETLKELSENPYLEPPEGWQVVLALLKVGEADLAATQWLKLALQPGLPAHILLEMVSSASQVYTPQVSAPVLEELLPRVQEVLMHFGQDAASDGKLRLEAAKALEKLGWSHEASTLYLLISNSQSLTNNVRREATQAMRQLTVNPVNLGS